MDQFADEPKALGVDGKQDGGNPAPPRKEYVEGSASVPRAVPGERS